MVSGIDGIDFSHSRASYEITGEAHRYCFYLEMKAKGLPLMVFGQGMQIRKEITLPRYQRLDWASQLPYNILIFNDPTLFQSETLTLGWCTGTLEHPVLPTHLKIVELVRDFLNISNGKILFYGSSAGGFTSLMLASSLPGSSALVNNPQTDVFEFRRAGVQSLITTCFQGKSQDELRPLMAERFSFVEHIKHGGYVPQIYYLQNLLDDDHYRYHLLPLLDALKFRSEIQRDHSTKPKIIIDLYSDAKQLHNPVGLLNIKMRLLRVEPWFSV